MGTAWTGHEYGVQRRFETLKKITDVRDKILFDIGCGHGGYCLYALESNVKYVVGVDIDVKRLKLAKGLSKNYDNVDFVIAEAENLPFKTDSADAIFFIELIEHVNDEDACLCEVHRTLKPKGTILLTAPNRFHIFETHGMKISDLTIKNMFGIGIPFLSWMPNSLRRTFERARIYSSKQLFYLLKKHGFHVLLIEHLMPTLDYLNSPETLRSAMRKVFRVMEKIPVLNFMGRHVMFVAKK